MTLQQTARMLKHGLAVMAGRSHVLDLVRRGQRWRGPRVHVYGYHRIVPDVPTAARTCIGPLCISTRTLAAHLDYLMSHYLVWSLDDALDLLAGVRRAPPRDVAVITFDDGYRDALEQAAPLLAARRLPATIFVTTTALAGQALPHDRLFALVRRARRARRRLLGWPVPDRIAWPLARADFALQAGDEAAATDALLGALPASDVALVAEAIAAGVGEPGPGELPSLLRWTDLEPLADLGLDIGAHGTTHTHLPLENDEVLMEELAGTRAEIARRTGVPPSTFSYPAGRYDGRVVEAARLAGYRAALTTEDRRNRPGDDLFLIGRKMLCEDHGLGIGGRRVPDLIAAQLDGLFATLRLSRLVPGDRGLESPWS